MSTSTVWELQLLCILVGTWYCQFYFSYSTRYAAVSYCAIPILFENYSKTVFQNLIYRLNSRQFVNKHGIGILFKIYPLPFLTQMAFHLDTVRLWRNLNMSNATGCRFLWPRRKSLWNRPKLCFFSRMLQTWDRSLEAWLLQSWWRWPLTFWMIIQSEIELHINCQMQDYPKSSCVCSRFY